MCIIFYRLLKAFAEEQAIEDAIYYLSEALRKDVIDLEVFLKVIFSNVSILLDFVVLSYSKITLIF